MIWFLLVAFQAKHFLADGPLQGKYMLGKLQAYPKFILPLAAHAGVHAVGTFTIAFFASNILVASYLAALDFVAHFTIDVVKANPSLLGRFKNLSASDFMQLKNERDELVRLEPYGHFEIRRIDEKVKSNTYFYWALLADQSAHHLTHYFIIFIIFFSRTV